MEEIEGLEALERTAHPEYEVDHSRIGQDADVLGWVLFEHHQVGGLSHFDGADEVVQPECPAPAEVAATRADSGDIPASTR